MKGKTGKIRENIREAKLAEINDFYFSLNLLVVGILLLATVFFFRTFVFSSVRVSGSSMCNTLKDGDALIVEKTATPEYGDIIVFSDKEMEKYYIKRVIGLPGDVIKIEDGCVKRSTDGGHIFYELDEPYAVGKTLAFNRSGVYIVGKDRLFVLGDNRENSSDSRGESIGMPEYSQVLGVVPEWSVFLRNTPLSLAVFLF